MLDNCVFTPSASHPAPIYYKSTNGQRDLVRIRAFVRRDLTAVLPVPDVGFWEELVLITLSRYSHTHLYFSTGETPYAHLELVIFTEG